MTAIVRPSSTLKIDGAYKYLLKLTRRQRIPRFGQNGLPPLGTPLSADEEATFDNIGAPETVEPSPE